jgi:hemerythrin-like metal-binding protein
LHGWRERAVPHSLPLLEGLSSRLQSNSEKKDQFGVSMIASWRSAYKIGDAEIDAQHQSLFNKANALLASIDDPMLDACAAALYDGICEHIQHEETQMRNINYPALDRHVQQHHELLISLNEILENIDNANLSKRRLEWFISDLFLAHIKLYDTQVAAFVHARR